MTIIIVIVINPKNVVTYILESKHIPIQLCKINDIGNGTAMTYGFQNLSYTKKPRNTEIFYGSIYSTNSDILKKKW